MVSRIVSHLADDFAHTTLGEIDQTRSYQKEVLKGPNDGAGLFAIKNLYRLNDPILISSADGIGFKLMTALKCDKYEGIGTDLVALGINSIMSKGARPLYFLDRFVTGNLKAAPFLKIKNSIVAACDEAHCALIGGETAEHPELYKEKHFDISGFSVGVADRSQMLGAHKVEEHDIIVALSSSGLHTSGFLVAEKIMFDKLGHKPNDVLWQNEQGIQTVADELLRPSKIYHKAIKSLLDHEIHISAITPTVDGIAESIKRIVPINLTARVELGHYEMPRIFSYLIEKGGLLPDTMLKNFNMGLGLILILPKNQWEDAKALLRSADETFSQVGIITKDEGQRCLVKI